MTSPSAKRPYLLLDAGGTIVCPKIDLLIEVSRDHGHTIEAAALHRSFFERVHRYDERLRHHGDDPEVQSFLADVLAMAGVPRHDAARVLDRAKERSGPQSLWTHALPGVRDALHGLRAAGFEMSVVSNSDGTVGQQMRDLGLARFFDQVFDSHTLGVAKPDAEILRRVLAALDLVPEECLYVGDVVMIDVLCANAAGVRAVHLDPHGRYEGWPGLHTRDFSTFAAEISSEQLDLRDPRLLALA